MRKARGAIEQEEKRRREDGAAAALSFFFGFRSSRPPSYLTSRLSLTPLSLSLFSLSLSLSSLSLSSASNNNSYGYDPLGLGKDVEGVEKYRAAELIHARWAMLGAAGSIIPEGLKANGAELRGATWFEAPFELADAGSLTYFAVPWGIITNPLPLAAVGAINVALIAAVERFRATGEGPAGYSPGVGKFDSSAFDGLDPLYPGGPFDPLGLADDPETFEELKVKEIKNGRLAMGKRCFFGRRDVARGGGRGGSRRFFCFFFSLKKLADTSTAHNPTPSQKQSPSSASGSSPS